MNWLRAVFEGRSIGFSALLPWCGYKFSSRHMTPRFDENGDIYMLICTEKGNPK